MTFRGVASSRDFWQQFRLAFQRQVQAGNQLAGSPSTGGLELEWKGG